MTIQTRAAALLAFTAISGATLMSPPMTAAAAPVSHPIPSATHVSKTYDDRDLSSGRKAKVLTANRILTNALSDSGKTLNYSTANRYDNGDAKARRQVAAVWLWGGRKVSHLSATEKKKVLAEIPKKAKGITYRRTAATRSSMVITNGRTKKCEGVTKQVTVYSHGPVFKIQTFLNSCDTDAVEAWLGVAAGAAGVMALASAPSGAGPALFGMIAGVLVIGGVVLQYYQDVSDKNAVRITDRSHLLTITAQ